MADITRVGLLASVDSVMSGEASRNGETFAALITLVRLVMVVVGVHFEVSRITQSIRELPFTKSANVRLEILDCVSSGWVSHGWEVWMRWVVEAFTDELGRKLVFNHDTLVLLVCLLGGWLFC